MVGPQEGPRALLGQEGAPVGRCPSQPYHQRLLLTEDGASAQSLPLGQAAGGVQGDEVEAAAAQPACPHHHQDHDGSLRLERRRQRLRGQAPLRREVLRRRQSPPALDGRVRSLGPGARE